MAKKKLFETKTITSQGAKLHMIKSPEDTAWKLHRYGGPAVEPADKNSPLKKAYYLYGKEYDFETYESITKQREDMLIDENIENMRF
jgi:hypothetical protein